MLQKLNPHKANTIVHVGNKLLPHKEAKASIFDSSVQKGSTWDRLLVYQKELFCVEGHRGRLKAVAHALSAHVLYGVTIMEKQLRLTEFQNTGKMITCSLLKEGIPVSKIDGRITQSSDKDWQMCSAPSPP